ncbi:MAG: hypothetical protein AAB702_01875 [Patescibacteria group bacterium]
MKLRSIFFFALLPLVLYLAYLLFYFPIHGEIHLSNDIGRDFLLLQELDQKKIVLIGPRSNTEGLFHGPLWTYMNYPAYVISNGDPVTAAWFWAILGIVFLLTTFFIVRKLFGILPAIAASLLLSVRLIPHINSVFSPEAMFFFVPFFLFTITRYIESKKAIFLAFHLITGAIFVQLNIGVGILFLLMSSFLSIGFIIKNKLWKHLLAFLVVPLFLSNFIAFDIRHDFRMLKAILNLGNSSDFIIPFKDWIQDRLNNTVSIQLLSDTTNLLLFVYAVFALVVVATIMRIKNDAKVRTVYLVLLFYYFGYMVLSFFNKGIMLYHYIHLLIPLTTIWFVSFLKGPYKIVFAIVVFIVFLLNFNFSLQWVSSTQDSIVGKSRDSWTALKNVANSITDAEKGKEFGYFVFSPDSYAYQQRYAMIYAFKKSNAKAFEYVKKPITYVIASPPPENDPYMTYVWWVRNQVKISSISLATKKFPGGYTTEKFNLNKEEQKVPFDNNIKLGISFR